MFDILAAVPPPKQQQQRKIAWKTGTSYGHRDAWSIGVSSDWTIEVSVGRPDGVPVAQQLGRQQAAPIMFSLFDLLPADQAPLPVPSQLEPTQIFWLGGRRQTETAAVDCQRLFSIQSIAGKVPPTLLDSQQTRTNWKVIWKNPIGPSASNISTNLSAVPSADMSNASKNLQQQGLTSQTTQPAVAQAERVTVKIRTLKPQSIVFRPVQSLLPIHTSSANGLNTLQYLALQASGIPPFHWYLDGKLLENAQINLSALSVGIHQLSVVDARQRSDALSFEAR